MLQKLKNNWKQILTWTLSLVCITILHWHPELRDLLGLVSVALTSYGIYLWPAAFSESKLKAVQMARIIHKTGALPIVNARDEALTKTSEE